MCFQILKSLICNVFLSLLVPSWGRGRGGLILSIVWIFTSFVLSPDSSAAVHSSPHVVYRLWSQMI